MKEKLLLASGIGVSALLAVSLLVGQEQPPPPGQPAPPAPFGAGASGATLSPQQLEDLLAPIALYPDTLLSEILAASTYPLEVVEAEQWARDNPKLTGKKLMEKAQHQNWDPSVQALVAFPDVLARLNQDVRWTTDLGNAFLAQQQAVMAAVQRLRMRAEANGKLRPGPQENVTTATQNGQSAIEIQPADPGTVYVPAYNPDFVWGPPEIGYYPPLLYPPIDAGFSFLPGIDLGFYFGGGWGLWGGLGWGWGPNWFGGGIFVDPYFFHRFGFHDFHGGFGGGNEWAHDPGHRLGVAYPRGVAGRFGGAAGFRGAGTEGFRGGGPNFRGGNESSRSPGERFGTPGFERQNPGGNRSAFGGVHNNGGFTRMQSDHGFSSMGHAGGFGGARMGGGHAGGFGGGHGGGGGRR